MLKPLDGLRAATRALLSFIIILSVFQVNYSDAMEITSYARVSKSGDSIIVQSDRGNRNIVQPSSRVQVQPDIDSTLIDKSDKANAGLVNSEMTSSDKSTGRAIQSNYYNFPFSNLLTKPAGPINSGKVVVYPAYQSKQSPSYPIANNYYQRPRLPPPPPSSLPSAVMPNYMISSKAQGFQPAQRRFQYSPAKIYPLKGAGNRPSNNPRPLRGTDSDSSPPSAQGSKSAVKPLPHKPSATFSAPIFVPDYSSDQISSSNVPTHFMPTPVQPTDDAPTKSTTSGPIIDLLNFPKHVNTSYMPNELNAIKNAIDSNHNNHKDDVDSDNNDNQTFKFPPNIHSSFVPEMINNEIAINSYQPLASGEQSTKAPDDETTTTKGSRLPSDILTKFPPNIYSSYPSPTDETKNHAQDNSYYPAPSGENVEYKITENRPSSVPSKKLYNFPPNINSNYFPSPDVLVMSKSKENSYSPPESGVPSESNNPNVINHIETTYNAPRDLYNFPPNINSNYLPPDMNVEPEIPNNSYIPPPSGNKENNSTFDNPPPILNQFLPPVANYNYAPQSSGSVNGFDVGSMMENIPDDSDDGSMSMPMATPSPPPADNGPMPQYLPPEMPAAPAPMMPMDMAPMMPPAMQGYQYLPPPAPPTAVDFPKWQFDHHDIIYDYDHHHHHHHDHDDTTTTTAAPEPEEPRVKKYSYYYLGRKLWYIPLYFTLWFCLYVVALIIRSIGRHKVDLPNHYVSRSMHDLSQKELIEKINRVTEFSMKQIEDFKEKYL